MGLCLYITYCFLFRCYYCSIFQATIPHYHRCTTLHCPPGYFKIQTQHTGPTALHLGALLEGANLRQLHRSKNNHQKIIVICQIIGSGQIDSFMCIESIIKSIHYPNFQNESLFTVLNQMTD